jgi:signal transduction histidine kinase
MGEPAEIAKELRDEVLQTILAVRLSLAYSASHDDWDGMRAKSAEAQEHLAAEARRLRSLIDRLGALAEELEAEDVAA